MGEVEIVIQVDLHMLYIFCQLRDSGNGQLKPSPKSQTAIFSLHFLLFTDAKDKLSRVLYVWAGSVLKLLTSDNELHIHSGCFIDRSGC